MVSLSKERLNGTTWTHTRAHRHTQTNRCTYGLQTKNENAQALSLTQVLIRCTHTKHVHVRVLSLSLSRSDMHTNTHMQTHSRRSLNSVTCPGSVSCYCLFNRQAQVLQLKSLLCNITVLSEQCVWPGCHSDGPGRQASRLVCSQYLQWHQTQREVSRSREGARCRAIDVRLGFHSLFILLF